MEKYVKDDYGNIHKQHNKHFDDLAKQRCYVVCFHLILYWITRQRTHWLRICCRSWTPWLKKGLGVAGHLRLHWANSENNPIFWEKLDGRKRIANYIGHLEIAKRIAVFCGWGRKFGCGGPQLYFTVHHPSSNSGAEYDQLSAVVRKEQGSKSPNYWCQRHAGELSGRLHLIFYKNVGGQQPGIRTNGIIKEKHPLKGSYTFEAFAKVGEKTISFSPVSYTIVEVDPPSENLPTQPPESNEKGALKGWHIALICIGGVAILCVIGAFVFEKQLKELRKKIVAKIRGKKVSEQSIDVDMPQENDAENTMRSSEQAQSADTFQVTSRRRNFIRKLREQ